MANNNLTVQSAVREFLEEANVGFLEYLEDLLKISYDNLGIFIETGGLDGQDLSNFINALCMKIQGVTAQSVFEQIVVQLRAAKKKKAEDEKRKQEELQKTFDKVEFVGVPSGERVEANAS